MKNEDLEKALFTWFKQARAMPLPVVGPTLCSKAEEIAKSLGVDKKKQKTRTQIEKKRKT